MKNRENVFKYLPEDFFKPLASKYKREYTDCIQLIFYTFQPEITYGINREIMIAVLENHFSEDANEMFFEDEELVCNNPRDKANAIIRYLKNCGWFEQETTENHEVILLLNEYAIPIIESFEKIIRNEEAEYQGIISNIYATLKNEELYNKPYELILKGVKENTDRLLSELKKLSVSIKRHMEKQTNEMALDEVLDHFIMYHKTIGSKAYLRMKTSENIHYFRNEILLKLEELLGSDEIMTAAVAGYMEIESESDSELAFDKVVDMVTGIKSAFYRLDDVIVEIDKKNAKYVRAVVMRAKFLLSSGNNLENKLLCILNDTVSDMNQVQESEENENNVVRLNEIIKVFPQSYIEGESLRTIPVSKTTGTVDEISENDVMSEDERKLYQEAMREVNRNRFTRKNINQYVDELLRDKDIIRASSLEIKSRRDVIRLIYISIYGNNKANCYKIIRTQDKIKMGTYQIPDFEIARAK